MEESQQKSWFEKLKSINFDELFYKFRYPFLVLFLGLLLIGLGILFYKNLSFPSPTKIDVLDDSTDAQKSPFIMVEVSGAVEKPGVYKLVSDSRVEDALISAGGISSEADRVWMAKSLNRAAKLIDGQKIYILSVNEQSSVISANNSGVYQNTSLNSGGQGSGLININTASQKELESLVGIGPVYAQSIIEHRSYSNIEELVSKGALTKSTYEKIKDKITVY